MKYVVIAILVLVLVGAGVYAYTRQFNAPVQTPATQTSPSAMQESSPAAGSPTTEPSMSTGSGAPQATKTFTVTGSEFAFSPSTLSVKKGDTIKITFKNGGQFPHNLNIEGLNVSTKTIDAGSSDTIQFTADKAGTFTYLCTVPGHADKGMKGTLTVQ